jgi:hypothetical protein
MSKAEVNRATKMRASENVSIVFDLISQSGAYIHLNGKRLTYDHGKIEVWQGTKQIYMGVDWRAAADELLADNYL